MKVKVEGAARKIDMIFRFDKDLWKTMQKEVREAGRAVQSDAVSRIPAMGLSRWGLWWEYGRGRDLSFSSGGAKRISISVRSKETSGFRRIKAKVGFASGNAAGAIFGLAGSQPGTLSSHPAGPIRSKNFKSAMNRAHGGIMGAKKNQSWPRALTPAYYAKGPQAKVKIGAAIERMVAAVNR
jgi:hypothetical protein